MSKKLAPALIHGFIDPYAPGGVEQLIEFNRGLYGNAVMSATGGVASGAGAGAGSGAGGSEPGAGATGGTESGAGGSGQQAGAGTGGATGGSTDDQLGEGGKRALDAERATVKQLKADLAERDAKIKGFEDAGKTAEQLREQELKELRDGKSNTATTLASRDLTILQYQVAAAAGLDLAAAERLRGTTKEELEADAKEWISKWGSAAGNGIVPGIGAQGSTEQNVAPGMERLRLGYAQSSAKKK